MILKSLEIQGFKSFPDKTKLQFHNGLTAVVGPNGSGKSNIADAMRWVLGEQSSKTLRGDKMEDVIFNGTQTRKQQGFAKVALTFDNSDRIMEFDSDEVTISRKYYRSGESTYLVNGTSVRLKDIHELLMDTGLGKDGYAIIGQGRIAEIVSAKSGERREIFEEAAGITKFRYRKQESQRRLKMTEENLVRLRDILGELEGRVEPLREQSEKAQKFLSLSQGKKQLQVSIWIYQLENSKKALQEQEDQIFRCKLHHEEITEEIEKIETAIQKVYEDMQRCSVEIENYRKQKSEIDEIVSQNHAKIAVYKNDISHNYANIERVQKDIEIYSASVSDTHKILEDKEKLLLSTESERTSIQQEISCSEEELLRFNETNAGYTERTKGHNEQLNKLTLEETGANMMLTVAQKSIEELVRDYDMLLQSKQEKENSAASTEKELRDLEDTIKSAKQQKESLQNTLQGYELKLKARKTKLDRQLLEYEKLINTLNEKKHRIKVLKDLEKNMEGFAYSVKNILNRAKQGRIQGVYGTVSQLISVDTRYSEAIETALGASMQNIVVNDERTAKSAIQLLKEEKGGRATFLPLTTIAGNKLHTDTIANMNGYIGIAADLVQCEAKYKDVLKFLLGRIVIAEDLHTGTIMAKKSGFKFRVVTLDGQVINTGGSFTGGSKNKNTGVLSRKNEIYTLTTTMEQSEKELLDFEQNTNRLKEEVAQLQAQVVNVQSEMTVLNEDLIRFEAEHKRLQLNWENNKDMIGGFEVQIYQNREKQKINQTTLTEQTEKLSELHQQMESIQKELEKTEDSYRDLREKRHSLSDHIAVLRISVLTKENDIENIRRTIVDIKERQLGEKEKIEALEAEIQEYKQNNEAIQLDILALEADTIKKEEMLSQIELAIVQIKQERDEKEASTTTYRKEERRLSSEREDVSKELTRFEERKFTVQKEYDLIISQLWEEYQMTRSEAEEIAHIDGDLQSAQKELNRMKNAIRELGSVNVAAIEEYQEVYERYTFLKNQIQDVESSKKELLVLIDNLTNDMQVMFLDSFKKISQNFSKIFVKLFGGGQASLELTDYDNVLECGIEIFVQPPGKIIKNLAALSGGEQAFVAIAIYFAILKVRPSPFCILDEIEAALDDVNVTKYAHYLRSMSTNTQFILITHRRGTMEEADILYGVTMQEEGVSKLLELQINEVENKLGVKSE